MAKYEFSTDNHNALADAFAHGFETPSGSLEKALRLAKTYECKITLTDAHGFDCGWVKADGDFRLT